MAVTLDQLQEKSLVHGDICPDNIMIDIKNGKFEGLKLVDFGSSYIFSDKMTISDSTIEYVSPEVTYVT
jgi:serine/threonine protein kinase